MDRRFYVESSVGGLVTVIAFSLIMIGAAQPDFGDQLIWQSGGFGLALIWFVLLLVGWRRDSRR